MSEHNRTPDQQQHVESHSPYLTVFFILLNYTAMEYVYAKFFHSKSLPLYLIGIALAITIMTAVLAKIYSLHFNRNWVYLTMVPAVILPFMPASSPLLGLMILAITKATLVGMWFMHLKFEGRWVYYMLVPAGILAVVVTLGLFPDIAMQPSELEQKQQEDNLSLIQPYRSSGASLS